MSECQAQRELQRKKDTPSLAKRYYRPLSSTNKSWHELGVQANEVRGNKIIRTITMS